MRLRAGAVVAVHVAGRFDPILDELKRHGVLDDAGYHASIEALGRHERRAGDLAQQYGGASRAAVAAVLRSQAKRRLSALEARVDETTRAHFEPGKVPARDATTFLDHEDIPVTAAPRRQRPGRAPYRPGPASTKRKRAPTRAELRTLAYRLHPDRHHHLPEAERRRMARRLAELTAAYHDL